MLNDQAVNHHRGPYSDQSRIRSSFPTEDPGVNGAKQYTGHRYMVIHISYQPDCAEMGDFAQKMSHFPEVLAQKLAYVGNISYVCLEFQNQIT